MPSGMEGSSYLILGTITGFKLYNNELTREKSYNLKIDSIGLKFEVCLNQDDLVGEPMVGMRFFGSCIMQGQLKFH